MEYKTIETKLVFCDQRILRQERASAHARLRWNYSSFNVGVRMPVHLISCPFWKYFTWHMQISFDVGPTWLTFAGGLLFGTFTAAAVAYVFLRNQGAISEPIRSKVKASR